MRLRDLDQLGGAQDGFWTASARNAMEQAFQDAALLGVTVCVASGDHGAADLFPISPRQRTRGTGAPTSTSPPRRRTPSPARHPPGGGRGRGGGIGLERRRRLGDGRGHQRRVPRARDQGAVSLPAPVNPGAGPGRGVPDVAGNADSTTGDLVRIHGQSVAIGGTSAVGAPLGRPRRLLNESLGAASASSIRRSTRWRAPGPSPTSSPAATTSGGTTGAIPAAPAGTPAPAWGRHGGRHRSGRSPPGCRSWAPPTPGPVPRHPPRRRHLDRPGRRQGADRRPGPGGGRRDRRRGGELHILGATDAGGLFHAIRHADGTWTAQGDVKAQIGDPGRAVAVAVDRAAAGYRALPGHERVAVHAQRVAVGHPRDVVA